MKRILLLSMVFSFVFALSAWAQRTISGKVTDDSGEGLPGVNVVIKGTTTGVTTDLDGNYQISIPNENAVLVFSSVGMATQEVVVGARSVIDLGMRPDTKELQEIVVTGYGSVESGKNVASVSSVSADKINNIPMPDINQIIQGRTPGVYSTAPSGQPGAQMNIRVRGTGSISAGRGPLYVIDGVIMQNGDFTQQSETNDVMSNINPNDIENITVLKDAAATSLYGSRGANGVILITTKRGKSGASTITARMSYGVTQPNFGNFKTMNAQQVWDYERLLLTNAGQNPETGRPESMLDSTFNYVDAAFRNGVTRNYEVQAQGGNESTRYFVSGGYYEQDGTLIESSFKRYSVRSNIDQYFNERIDLSVSMNVSYTDQLNAVAGNRFASPLLGAFSTTPLQHPVNPNTGEYYTGLEDEWIGFTGDNFLYSAPRNPVNNYNLRSIGKAELGINVLENLRVAQVVSMDFISIREKSFFDPTTNDGFADNGSIGESATQSTLLTTQTKVSGNWNISDDHQFSGLGVFEFQKNNYNDFSATGIGLATGQLQQLGSTASPQSVGGSRTGYAFVSYLGQLNYNFKNRYYLSLSGRRDGSSRFGADNRWANFWSVGASWRLIDESFMNGVGILSDAKIRTSYGTSGNAGIGNFASLGLYGFGAAYNGNPGSLPTQISNPNLTWETSTTINIGLDYGVLNNRIYGSIDWYRRESDGLLLAVPVSSTSGFTTATRNIGAIENKGVEIVLSTVNLNPSNEIKWTTDFNIAFNRNKVLRLNNGEDIVNGRQLISEGLPIRTWYLQKWAGVNPADGTPLWYTQDGDLTGVYGQAGRFAAGNAEPAYTGGLNNSVSYKGLTFSAFFYFAVGHEIYNASRPFVESDGQRYGWTHLVDAGKDYWEAPGDVASRPRPVSGGNNASNSTSTRYAEDGSFLRLRNIQLAYTLPTAVAERITAKNIRVWAQGQNLLTWTKYSGFDPEMTETGDEFFRYPVGKTYTLGLEVTF